MASFSPADVSMWLPGCCYLLAALPGRSQTRAPWKRAILATWIALICSILSLVSLDRGSLHPAGDLPGHCMLVLISFLAVVITRYSESYLKGEQGQRRFLSALMATFGFSSAVMIAPRLDLLLVAWILSSVALNALLLYYPDRRAARMAAHKKFLVSRTAEALLLAGTVVLYRGYGTLNIAALNHAVLTEHPHTLPVLVFSLCLSLAVILKSAQLPLHGWLIQVMEAPTPVSALLHAGIVNLGGVLLLRLHPFLDAEPWSQFLLTASGVTTLVIAGVVMLTRVSIKVRLAWSTCAQMGFLLAECGAGLYGLALLHLIGHSLYKSYLFLSSGSVVQTYGEDISLGEIPILRRARVWPRILSLLILAAAFWGGHALLARTAYVVEPVALVVLAVGVAPLLATGLEEKELLGSALARILSLLALYYALHLGAGAMVRSELDRPRAVSALFALGMALLYAVQIAVRAGDARRLSRLRIWAFHGFYLDEIFTRYVLAIWPIKVSGSSSDPLSRTSTHREYA